jgi:hypothetical protein
VGALREPPGTTKDAPTSFAELRALFESIRDERVRYDKIVKIFECPNLRQPVVALSTDQTGTPIPGAPGRPTCLYVWPWYEPERAVDFEWLVQAVWCHFRVPICDGEFSYDRTRMRFHTFDEGNLQFILRALEDEDAEAEP